MGGWYTSLKESEHRLTGLGNLENPKVRNYELLLSAFNSIRCELDMTKLWKIAKWHSQRTFHRAFIQVPRTVREGKSSMIQTVLAKTKYICKHTHMHVHTCIPTDSYFLFGKSHC